MSISTSTSSVVERASKEISRRMHSLGFKTNSKASNQGPPAASDQPKVLTETDKLNGNNEQAAPEDLGAASTGPEGPLRPDLHHHGGVVLRRAKPVSAAAKQPAARASMSSIIKGSVMDKVTHVFNNGVSMGNANNSKGSADLASTKEQLKNPAEDKTSNLIKANATNAQSLSSHAETSDLKALQGMPAGVNIPKGKRAAQGLESF